MFNPTGEARYDTIFTYASDEDTEGARYAGDTSAGIGVSNLINVLIEDADTDEKIFGGYIVDVDYKVINATLTHYAVACVDYTSQLDHIIHNGEYTTATNKAIIQAVFAGTDFDATTVENIHTFDYINIDDWDAKKVLDTLAEMIFADWWIDAEKNVHFTSSTLANAPFSIDCVAPDNIDSFAVDLKYKEDWTRKANQVIVRGGLDLIDKTPIRVVVNDSASQAVLGVLSRAYVNKDIVTEPLANVYAATLLQQHLEPVRTGSFSTMLDGLRSGQIINIKSDSYGIDQAFQIRDITMSWVKSNNESEGHTKYEVSFGDYVQDHATRLIKLGRQLEDALTDRSVPNPGAGSITGSMIAGGAIDFLQLANHLRDVPYFASSPSLPSVLHPLDSFYYNTTSNKWFQNQAGTWQEVTESTVKTGRVPTVSVNKMSVGNLIGGISSDMIISLDIGKVYGTVASGGPLTVNAGAVTGTFAAGSISIHGSNIQDATIPGAKIVSITKSQINSFSVTNSDIVSLAGSKIDTLSVDGSKLMDATINDVKMLSVSVGKLTAGEASFSSTATFRNNFNRISIDGSAIQITDLTRYIRLTSGGIYVYGGEIQLGAPSGSTPPFRVTSAGAIEMVVGSAGTKITSGAIQIYGGSGIGIGHTSFASSPVQISPSKVNIRFSSTFNFFANSSSSSIGMMSNSSTAITLASNMTLKSTASPLTIFGEVLVSSTFGGTGDVKLSSTSQGVYIGGSKVLANRAATISDPALCSVADAGGSYGSGEQALINDLKSKLNALNENYRTLLNALGHSSGHGLINH